jgi:glycosyltransferase involved in cell wall biosynthesis
LLKETVANTEVVIAALNEETGIGITIDEISKYLLADRVLVVDGRSVDRTIEVAKDRGAGILLQNGIGKGDAILSGIKNLRSQTKYVVFTDADYTYPAEYVPSMLEMLEQNPEVGMVCGNRLSGDVKGKTLHTRFYFGNKMLSFAHNLLNGIELQDPLTGLRVIRSDILRKWNAKSKGFDIEVELNSLVQRQGYLTVEIPIEYRERIGEKKLKMKDGATILKRILLETIN